MKTTSSALSAGLSIRPVRDSDAPFVASLYRSTRDDLRLVDAEDDFIEELIEMQFRAQTQGYGGQYPNAMYLLIELHGQPIGRAAVDFGHNEVRVVDIAFTPATRGKGYGAGVIRSLQLAAGKNRVPLTLTALLGNARALQFYAGMGFRMEQQTATHALLAWYPGATGMHG